MAEPLPHTSTTNAESLSEDEPEDPSELARQLEELESELTRRSINPDPVSPNTMRNTAMGGVAGLVISLGIIFLTVLLDNKIKVMRIEVETSGC